MTNNNQNQFVYKGAIVRIRIRNFMTYTDTELRPGPNLNMILGPNGTGKSAIVCCIIVGLAGEVSLTGRGGSPADFVKKDTDYCTTEIELYNDHGNNYVIERRITIVGRTQFKIDHKSEWKINGKSALKAEVTSLTRKLNIKVDNLCQFLPQDSVTQFVKMNTCELLLNTLKAAGDNQLVEDHQTLIRHTEDIEEKSKTLETLQKGCKENEVNAKRLESEVHQLREREELVKQRDICSQKIHYVNYTDAKAKYDQAKAGLDSLKEQLREIEKNSEPFRKAVELHKSEYTRYKECIEKSDSELSSLIRSIQTCETDIENYKLKCQEEVARFRGKLDQENERTTTIRLKEQELENLSAKLADLKDIDCTKEIRVVQNSIDLNKEDRKNCGREKASLEEEQRRKVTELDNIRREMDSIKAVRAKKTNLLRIKSPEAHRVLEWLTLNQNKFSEKVFPPIMCEINVKDARYNRIVEHAISRPELLSFVCQNEQDVKLFTRCVRDELRTKFNVILAPDKSVDSSQRLSSQHQNLSHLGVKAFLIDLIDAPDPIKRYLCASQNFHRIPVADTCSESQLKELLKSFPKFYQGNQVYTVTKSRYDDQAMTVNENVREGQFLQFSLDVKRLEECQAAQVKLNEAREAGELKLRDLLRKEDELRERWQSLVEKHKELKQTHDERKRLETLIGRLKEALEKLANEKIDIEVERRKLQKSIDEISRQILTKLQSLVKISVNVATLKELHMLNLLLSKLANRNANTAYKRYNASKEDTTRLKEAYQLKLRGMDGLKNAFSEAEKVAKDKLTNFDNCQLDKRTKRKFDSITENTIEELIGKKEELKVRIQRIYRDANNCILAEFNKQNEELREKRTRIAELESDIKVIATARDEIKTSWVPKLQDVINVIDANYREFMHKLSYDGQVKLDFDETRPNDFSIYGIKILVKYRDNEQLIPLSSTRQSGGERSVATMIYMLALQTKTSVPFRCVDEINQGMDKDNERKVFELLVQTADSSSSQYFLVSPKLLSNLPYSEKMKIHVVFNGKKLKLKWDKF